MGFYLCNPLSLLGGPVGIDPDLVLRRLEELEDALTELEEIASMDLEEFLSEKYVKDAAKYRLITAIEAAISVCNHIVAKLGKPANTYSECFLRLSELGVISEDLAHRLSMMAKFRNMLVHIYWRISDERVYSILRNDIGDLRQFVDEVLAYVERTSKQG